MGTIDPIPFLAMKMHIKAFAVLLGLISLSTQGLAQGRSAFANNPVYPVAYGGTGIPVGPEVTVGLYYSTDLNAAPEELVLGGTTPVVTQGVFNNGGQPLVLPIPADTFYIIALRAWTGGYASYEEALSQGVVGVDQVGDSGILRFPLVTAGPTSPPTNLMNAGLVSIVLTPVPEPTALVLSILFGGASVIVLSRRKN